MEHYLNILNSLMKNRIIQSLIVIFISLVIYRFTIILMKKSEVNSKKKNGKDKTYLRLIANFLKYAMFIMVALILLQINGIDVNNMMAGLGILSIIIGFIVQDAFKDIIRGLDILSDKYFVVGDIVKYNGIEGKVLMVGLKTTKIEDVRTFNVISIANRNIEQVEVISDSLDIVIPMPYELPVQNAEKAIKDILEEVERDNRVKSSMYKGITNFGESGIDYLINVHCMPVEKIPLRREILRIIMLKLNKYDIAIPYKQIDIHTK